MHSPDYSDIRLQPSFLAAYGGQIMEIAQREGRHPTNVVGELVFRGLVDYQSWWTPSTDLERLTQCANAALQEADKFARQMGQDYVATEHLLKGIVEVRGGVASKVLVDTPPRVTAEAITNATLAVSGRGTARETDPIELAPRTRKVLHLALSEARRLGHEQAGTGHLLIALFAEMPNGQTGVKILAAAGLGDPLIRETLQQAISSHPQLVVEQ